MLNRILFAAAGALSLAACVPAPSPTNDYVVCDTENCGDNVTITVEE